MNCPICQSKATHITTSPYDYAVYSCVNDNCDHLFLDESSGPSGICHLSETLSQVMDEQKRHFQEYGERNRRLIYDLRLRGFIYDGADILDFGAGFGGVSHAIKEQIPTASITAIEACDSQRALLNIQGIKTYPSLERAGEKTFDFIVMIEVLEHLQDPVAFLGTLSGFVKNNGVIFITTPCGRLKNGTLFGGFDTKSHQHFFSEKSLGCCLKKCGFRVPRFEYLRSFYPDNGLVDRWMPQLTDTGHCHLVTFAELR